MNLSMVSEGDPVPKFELEDADGKLVKSSDLKGKNYVDYFLSLIHI